MNHSLNKRLCLVLALVATATNLYGCSAADLEAGYGFDGGPGPDGGVCRISTPQGCVNDLPRACTLKAAFGSGCVDEDNDCFVENCNSDTPKWFVETFRDCNDLNADIHPLGLEKCNGRDEDCDERVDESFEALGAPCNACGADGVLECNVDDPGDLACSTRPGQSGASPVRVEQCNGEDDDCDGRIDEACQVPVMAGLMPLEVSLCNDRMLVVTMDGLVSVDLSGEGDAVPLAMGAGVRFPRCQGDWTLWLATEEPCAQPPDGPLRCRGQVWVKSAMAEPEAITPVGLYGPAVLTETTAYWHSVVGDRPQIDLVTLGEVGVTTIIADASDPVGPVAEDQLFVRTWTQADRPRVELRSISAANMSRIVGNPVGASGVPVVSEGWAAWTAGPDRGAIWIVPMGDTAQGGFQLPLAQGRYSPLEIVGDHLFYQDQGSALGPVHRFDLSTGQTTLFVAQAVFDSVRISKDGRRAIWLDPTAEESPIRFTTNVVPQRDD